MTNILLKCFCVKLIKKQTCTCFLRCSKKVVSKLLLRVKDFEDPLKPICMIKNASTYVLDSGRASKIRMKLHQSLHHNDKDLEFED